MKTVVQLCDYSPMYGGNFIPSLAALQRDLARRSCRCVFIFPLSAQSRGWTRLLSEQGGTLYFTDFNAGKVEFIRAVHTILKNERADILHSHFTSILSVEIISWLSPGVKTFIHVHSDFSGGKKTLTEQAKEIVYYRLMAQKSASCAFQMLLQSVILRGACMFRTPWRTSDSCANRWEGKRFGKPSAPGTRTFCVSCLDGHPG